LSTNLDKHWKIKLYLTGNGDVFGGKSSKVSKQYAPITHGFCEVLEKLKANWHEVMKITR
jgi:hypothetical protein